MRRRPPRSFLTITKREHGATLNLGKHQTRSQRPLEEEVALKQLKDLRECFQFDPSMLRRKINFDEARVIEGICWNLWIGNEQERSIFRRAKQLKKAKGLSSDTSGVSSTRLILRQNATDLPRERSAACKLGVQM
jgi:hypothetical protein